MIIPKTSDGRVLFAIPWQKHVLIGTTDTALETISREPKPQTEEIDYLLDSVAAYLAKPPTRADILSTFAGLRPLVKPKGDWKSTASLSRDFSLTVSPAKLVTITGGKWTTYRKMGQETVDLAVKVAGLPNRPSQTKKLPIHGWTATPTTSEWHYYGADLAAVEKLAAGDGAYLQKLHCGLPIRPVDILWAVRQEMARNVEDMLSRRSRCLLLNAKASLQIAPKVADIMAQEMGKDNAWQKAQLEAYQQLTNRYAAA